MHRTRNQNREDFRLTGESIPELLHSAKTVLSEKQYRELCAAVNEVSSYPAKKELIFAAAKAKIKRKE